MFPIYPYINVNDLNLDYLLKSIKEIQTQVEYFVSLNAIKYADPIQWDITRQYEKNTIVIDPQTGTAYISVAPVPIGAQLTRPEYWTVVFDLGSFVVRASKNFAINYEADTTTTATFNTPAGGWLVWGDVLYIANVPITAGDSYVEGGNISHFTMEEIIGHLNDLSTTNKNSIVDALNELFGALNNAVSALSLMIGDLNDLTTSDKTSVVNAINSLQTDITTLINVTIGDLNDLTTSDKTSVVNAINSLVNDLGDLSNDLTTLDNKVGDLNDLTTSDKDSVVDAINEVKSDFIAEDLKIGDLDDLITSDKTSIVNAINDIASIVPHDNINVMEYGAKGDGVTDDTQAINDAITAYQSANKPLYFPYTPNGYLVTSGITINCHHASDVLMKAPIIYYGSGTALKVVNADHLNLELRAGAGTHAPFDTSNIGLELNSIQNCNILIPFIEGFYKSIYMTGQNSGYDFKSVGYNNIVLGWISDGKYGIYIKPQSNGWVNENSFYKGRIRVESTGTYIGQNIGIYINTDGHVPNNNIFHDTCIEGALCCVQIDNGRYNSFYDMRDEGSTAIAEFNSSNAHNNVIISNFASKPWSQVNGARYNTVKGIDITPILIYDSLDIASRSFTNASSTLSCPPEIVTPYNTSYSKPQHATRYTDYIGSSNKTIMGVFLENRTANNITIESHCYNDAARACFKLYDSSMTEITDANITGVNYVNDSDVNTGLYTTGEDFVTQTIIIPSNVKYIFIGIKRFSRAYSFRVLSDGLMSIAKTLPEGLSTIPTCAGNTGEFCRNNDSANANLIGWFYDGSAWQPEYITSTPPTP